MQSKYKEISITALGEPIPQGRPRFVARGKFVRAIDPAKSRDEKAYIRSLATDKALSMHWDMLGPDNPVEIIIRAYKSIPTSHPTWYKKAAKNGLVVPTKRSGDADNIAKLILDSLSGVWYRDDKQVYKLDYECAFSETPRIEIVCRLYYVNIGEIKQQLKAQGELTAVRTKKNGRSII